MKLVLSVWLSMVCVMGWAEDEAPKYYMAEIESHNTNEIYSILKRAEDLMSHQSGFQQQVPIALVLHGDEVETFLHENYQANKEIVDLAAKLDAFNIVDIQICETWMGEHGISREQLPPFVNTVPYGPAKEEELKKQGYIYF
ncbi:hypothetical protein [Gynuella sp.]|uniref:DsrE family protein n=1 Tax=Gynuella sp. TaxID=2969146 RepID=UPI003D13AE89